MTRRNVALLIESSRSYGRALLGGVALYARTRGDWSLLHEEMTIDSVVPDWLTDAHPSGVIARLDDRGLERLGRLGVPVVDVRCSTPPSAVPQVDTDNQRVTQLAFDHLWKRGFRRFAFCGYRGVRYSDERLRHFRELVTASNRDLAVYEAETTVEGPLTAIERSGVAEGGQLAAWLGALVPPTGLFVCNDIRGQQVLNACRTAGVAVPDDVGVIGVDDDDVICPLCDPPLSSVNPGAERVGYRAAELLDLMMDGTDVPAETECIAPSGVAQRLSTRVIAVEDREVARVCRFIRERACDGIDVGDVTEFTRLSRRQLERRFHGELGRTLHEELTAVRIERVRQLLVETDLTLERLAPLAGYDHKERLSAVFKRETGETPGEYRKRMGSDVAPQ